MLHNLSGVLAGAQTAFERRVLGSARPTQRGSHHGGIEDASLTETNLADQRIQGRTDNGAATGVTAGLMGLAVRL